MALYDRTKARRSLFDTITYRIVSQIATVGGYIVLVRAMNKEDFGIFNLLYSFIPLVGTAASLGLEQTLRRFQPEYLRTGNLAAGAWLVKRVAALRLCTNLLVLSVVLLAWNHVAPHFDLGPYRSVFALFCLLMLLHFQTQILQLTMAAHMLHRFSVGSVAMLSIVKAICYVGLALGGALSLRAAIYADTAAYVVIYVFLRVVHARHGAAQPQGASDGRASYRPGPDERRRLVRYAAFNNFNDAGTLFLDSRIDNFFIAGFMNTIAVGIYSFYTRLNEMAVNVLPSRLFDNIIQPMFFAVKPADADARLPQYFTFLLNANLLLLWPLFAFSCVYHSEIVRVVFGGKYIEQSWLLAIIIGFALLNAFSTPVALVAQYEEKAHIQLLSKVFAFYNIAALLVLIPAFGIYGAALAIGSSQFFKNSFVWWFVRRRAVWLNALSCSAYSVLLWGCAAGLCAAAKQWIGAPAIAQLFLGVLIFGGAVLLYVRGPVLSRTDRELLLRLFAGKEARLLRLLGLLQPPVSAAPTTR